MNMIQFLQENYAQIGQLLVAIGAVAEIIVRLTPTKSDDGALERAGHIIKKVMDFLKIPNIKK